MSIIQSSRHDQSMSISVKPRGIPLQDCNTLPQQYKRRSLVKAQHIYFSNSTFKPDKPVLVQLCGRRNLSLVFAKTNDNCSPSELHSNCGRKQLLLRSTDSNLTSFENCSQCVTDCKSHAHDAREPSPQSTLTPIYFYYDAFAVGTSFDPPNQRSNWIK